MYALSGGRKGRNRGASLSRNARWQHKSFRKGMHRSWFSLGPHRVGDRTRLAQFRGQVGEFAQQWTRVARIDDLLDEERLGGAERRAVAVEPLLDFDAQSVAVRRRVEIGAIGRLDAALHGKRASVARRPGVAVMQSLMRGVP